MIIGHGVDVVDVDRIRRLLTTMEEDFLLSTFTRAERSVACEEHERVLFFAGRLAAKEAVGKALGTGFTGEISWLHVEILPGEKGHPQVRLTGPALAEAERLGIDRWLLSISHVEAVAFASAISVREGGGPLTAADPR
ncbi:MAG TPA: holo-ACP synthase [Gemmataceae bacterium]|jgi:holo-[acyl-carrier protein] synthase